MTPIPTSLECNCESSEEMKTRIQHVGIGIKDAYSFECFLEWITKQVDLHQSKITLVHIACPPWMDHVPSSGLGGRKMLVSYQANMVNIAGLLDEGRRRINLLYPNSSVEFCIETGDPITNLSRLVESGNFDRLVVFPSRSSWNPLNKNVSSELSKKFPQVVEIVTVSKTGKEK